MDSISRREFLVKSGLTLAAAALAPVGAHAEGSGPAAAGAAPAASPAPPGKYSVPPLGFAYDALEPHMDAVTMHLHHDKHHQAYVDKLNAALAKAPDLNSWSLEQLVKDWEKTPESVRTAVRNHGGGHWNHSFFWELLAPGGAKAPPGALAAAIDHAYTGFESFRKQFEGAAAGVFGSGWAWLALDSEKKLQIVGMPNQDNPITKGLRPLLALDVWEHAYYLKYQNRRPEYIAAFWNVVNWDAVSRKFTEAQG